MTPSPKVFWHHPRWMVPLPTEQWGLEPWSLLVLLFIWGMKRDFIQIHIPLRPASCSRLNLSPLYPFSSSQSFLPKSLEYWEYWSDILLILISLCLVVEALWSFGRAWLPHFYTFLVLWITHLLVCSIFFIWEAAGPWVFTSAVQGTSAHQHLFLLQKASLGSGF